MFNMISRSIKEGFSGVIRHFAMALSSAIAVTITLLLISVFMLFMINVSQFTKNVESGIEISVLVDTDHENEQDIASLQKKIEALSEVKSVRYSSKDDELKYYIAQFDQETQTALQEMIDENPMHDAFYVEVKDGNDIRKVADTIEAFEGVDSINYGGASTVAMVKLMNTIRRIGLILVFALTALAIFLIQNTIKLTIYARHDEIMIERSVGATNRFIRSPFVVEGILIGIMGSIVPIALTYYGYSFAYRYTGGYIVSSMFRLLTPLPLTMYLCAALLLIGIVVGLIGSYLSVTRYLKWKR